MEKIHKKLIFLVLAALLIGTVSATVWQFLLKKPSTFTIQTNPAAFDLYTTAMGPGVATEITWPSIFEGAPSGSIVNSTVTYMALKTDPLAERSVILMFSVVNLPASCTIAMYVKTTALGWSQLTPNIELTGLKMPVLGKKAGADTYFQLDYDGTAVGAYTFTINIYVCTV